ncbi:Type VI secretion protein ImpA (modular protein) [Burkholderia sp. 8Y]|uniref:type VI secretion system tip protein TssI/VgrG n=1 Tax=Burkholderia sp. 8Y TaxID=2653133 RepID=UPI0012F0BD4F|nr:type VI secretion system tip protein TssI/VgrG [Burkholderia sp. 8Y]VXB39346.1 Type VI secretion protein ImpA (modular protein) [Burkholderia sp. 8Y]
MFNPLQSRTLKVECDALPTWGGAEILIPQRVRGVEALGELFQYEVDFASVDSPTFRIWDARKLLKPDDLIGKTIGIQIEFEGKGTFIPGLPGDLGAGNVGAGVRTINGLITEVQQTGSDDRRVYYRFTVRPWLWLATQNRDNRVFQDMSVLEVTQSVLKNGNYKFPWKTRLAAVALNNNVFPKRDFIRQFWQSDYEFLQQLWTEWGLYYHFDGMTLMLCDSPGSHKKHGNAYDTVLYHAPEDKRIDEEHIHSLKVLRQITPGDVTVNDYDYTQSNGSFDRNQQRHSESSFDNIEQYHWGDYTQPLAGAMGLDGQPNDLRNEADYLARVRVEALRSEGFRLHATANARGIMTGRRLKLEGHPEHKLNANYLVVSTSIDIRNSDELTVTPGSDAQYHCVTEMVLQPATIFFKLIPTAKPRAHPETAVVVGPEKQPLWLDGYARVRVQFKWDRLGQMAQNSSCWVRVSLPWHGGPHSFVSVPRIGDEVTIGYHEGDPDKPFVMSSKVNQFNPPPFNLPKNMALTRADWVTELEWIDLHSPCLSLLRTPVDADSLVAHLQAFLFAEIGDNMTAMIRYFDPRNTSAVLDIWGKEIRELFTAPIEQWMVRGRYEGWQRIQDTPQRSGPICASVSIRLEQAQTDALMAHTEPDELLAVLIENEVVDGTRPYFARLTDFLPRYRQALQWGITEPGDRLLFCQYSYLYGAAFDRHSNVHEALTRRKRTGESFRLTISQIPKAVWDYISRQNEKLLALTTGGSLHQSI